MLSWGAIGSAVGMYLALPLVLTLKDMVLEWARDWMAGKSLQSDPLYDVNSELVSVNRGSLQLFGMCRIKEIRNGKVVVVGLDKFGKETGQYCSWGVRDFLTLHKISLK